MTKYNICTNFYSNYLPKGLAMYRSLEATSKNFCLWILCMDDTTFKILSELKLSHARLIRLKSLENKDLLKIKTSRNKAEYCWTLKSIFMEYIFNKKPHIRGLLYLDGDIYFFNDIGIVFNDIGNQSIAITPHRFPSKYRIRASDVGIFNAGVVYFKRDKIGFKALRKWRADCIKWCYWRHEDGKLADQMYLDEWPELYINVHQFTHPGINFAPWNIYKNNITYNKGKVNIDGKPLVFFHFHQLKVYPDLTFTHSNGYIIPEQIINFIYKPYEKALMSSMAEVEKLNIKIENYFDNKSKVHELIQKTKAKVAPLYWQIKTFLHKS